MEPAKENVVKSLQEIADHFEVDLHDDDGENKNLVKLEKAIDEGRVFLAVGGKEDKLCVDIGREVMTLSEEGLTSVLKFRRLKGSERRTLNNAGGKTGDAAYQCIARLCNITERELSGLPSPICSLLEQVMHFFL